MLTPSLPTEASSGLPLSARRRIQAGMLATSAAGVPRTGLLAASAALVVTGTTDPAMTYRVAPFVGASSRDGVGAEFVANDASETVPAGAVAPSSNSRIDVIWFRSRFPSLTDAGVTAPIFGVTRGVADANPQKPTNIPAGAEELATAVVTSSDLTTQTVVITNTARLTAFAGGVVALRNQAEENAWTPPDGDLATRLDTGALLQRINGAWQIITGPTPVLRTTIPAADGLAANEWNLLALDAPSKARSLSWTAGASSNSKITAGRAGAYLVAGAVVIQGSARGEVRILVNRAARQQFRTVPDGAGYCSISFAYDVDLNAGDYVQVEVSSNTGGAILSGYVSARYIGGL